MQTSSVNRAGLNKKKPTKVASNRAHVIDAANQLLSEGKKLAQEIYAENAKKVTEAQDSIKDYSEGFTHKVKQNPIASLLIAGGIGFILSAMLRRR